MGIMNAPAIHPDEALFSTTDPAYPIIPVCDHYAGSEKLMRKSLQLQRELGPIFDITFDCEDGAVHGAEQAHRELIVQLLLSPENRFKHVGVRVHDSNHPAWRADVDWFLEHAGSVIAHLTVPKVSGYDEAARIVEHIETRRNIFGLDQTPPIHLLIESQGALRDIWQIAALPGLRGLDFGIMDFVSSHCGAIPADAVRSPSQFDHRLVARAKTELVAAALAHGLIPAHNVTLNLSDPTATAGDATRAHREFGFLRMWSIHPLQIKPIVAALSPDFTTVAHAADVLLAAQRAAWGPIRHGNELFDRASYRGLWDTLRRAKQSGVELPATVLSTFFG
jgi:citrate lyase subunit beta/citryl-CoA lyase